MLAAATLGLTGCNVKESKENTEPREEPWQIEQFADIRIMRYEIPNWDSLTPQQRKLAYCLSQAALCGRDILWDQNYEHNLAIRHILEAIYSDYEGERSGEEWNAFEVYLKRVWFANGIHHHYGMAKFEPGFTVEYFRELIAQTPIESFPEELNDEDELLKFAVPILFDPIVAPMRVNKAAGEDVLLTSSMNYYKGVSQKEAEKYYRDLAARVGNDRLAYGMNTQLVKEEGKISERVWKVGGMYSEAIERIIEWLEKALPYTESDGQHATITALISYYKSGSLEDFNTYSVEWTKDTEPMVDFVNGFIEDYGDPLGIKCSWEAIVNFKDLDATRRTQIVSDNALWFESNSPIDEAFKKKEVRGVTAKVINAVMLGGDCYPSTPIGINLPNASWIRREHGSKSVTIENITSAYDKAAQGNGFLEEFAASQEEIERARKYGSLASNIHTDLHECLGHGSGQLAPGVSGGELKNYGSTLEESRADLFALYYIADPKLVELGVLPEEGEYAKAEYDSYIRNGLLTQITRIKLGDRIEQDHMRNRALIANWCYEHGKEEGVIVMEERDGKHYIRINDYKALRGLFAELLREVQRIKSTGDFEAGKALVEQYGVNIDQALHAEILERYAKLNLAPYGGFVNPILEPVYEGDELVDVRVNYTQDYAGQMMRYSKEFGFLPIKN